MMGIEAVLGWVEWVTGGLSRWLRVRGDQKAVAKDLYFEMLTNAERALSGSSTGMPQTFEDKSWQGGRKELAHLLDGQAFDKIRTAYASAGSLADMLADSKSSSDWRMRTTAAKLGLEFVHGALELLDKAFGKAERQETEDRLRKLENRLRTSEEINFRQPHLG
jgi:hypothetical protein